MITSPDKPAICTYCLFPRKFLTTFLQTAILRARRVICSAVSSAFSWSILTNFVSEFSPQWQYLWIVGHKVYIIWDLKFKQKFEKENMISCQLQTKCVQQRASNWYNNAASFYSKNSVSIDLGETVTVSHSSQTSGQHSLFSSSHSEPFKLAPWLLYGWRIINTSPNAELR